MVKVDFQVLADDVIRLVGGKENITFLTHCITRLRFNVKDRGLVDLEGLKKLNGVIGAQWSNEQLQVVIGPKVADAFKAVSDKTGFGKDDYISTENTNKKFHPSMILDGITGCLTPLLPVMIGSGMIKVVLLLGQMAGIINPESSTSLILNFASDSGFYFLPVFIGATAARKFGGNMGLGMLLGAMLIHPDFIGAIAEGRPLDLLGLPIYSASYTHSIFPAIISVFIMSKVEQFVAKHSPSAIRTLLQPLVTLLVMIPFSIGILSPAGAFLGEYFASAMMWLYNTTGFLGIGILASLIPLVILTGMHLALNPGAFQMLATSGYDPIVMPVMVLNNMNQGIAALIVAIKTKSKDTKSLAISSAVTVIVGGVSEPAMFGINLKYKKPLVGAMIGNFFAGCVAGLMKAKAVAFASMGIFGFPAFIDDNNLSSLFAILSGVGVGIVVTAIVTYILVKPEELN